MTKGAGETIENEVNETKDIPKGGFLGILLGSLLGNLFPGKGVRPTSQKRGLFFFFFFFLYWFYITNIND